MSNEQVSIRTHDGECPTSVFTPSGNSPHPAVIFYMDGLGIRPTVAEMGQRLADYGYVVLVPDLFYRAGPYEPLDPKKVFASGDVRAAIGHLFASTDNRRAGEDTAAFLAYLDSREDVAGTKVGTTGYCMGGAISLRPRPAPIRSALPRRPASTAATWPPTPTSARTTSRHGWPAGSMSRAPTRTTVPTRDGSARRASARGRRRRSPLRDLLRARHGWTMRDFPVYDEAAAERHWDELASLFGDTLT